MEIWKDIKGYEGYYQISNLGNVKSLDRIDAIGRVVKGRLLKWKHNNRGYFTICLKKDGQARYFLVHRLVALTFIPNGDGLAQVNHKDENKSNNQVDNLEWCNNLYNAHYVTRVKRAGVNHRRSVIARNGNDVLNFPSVTIAEERIGLSRGAINGAIKRNGTAKGYKFECGDDRLKVEHFI